MVCTYGLHLWFASYPGFACWPLGDSDVALSLKALTDEMDEKQIIKSQGDLYCDKGLHQWCTGAENASDLLSWETF